MIYSEAKKNAVEALRKAGIEEADVDAEYLLTYASGLEKSMLFVKLREEIPEEIEKKYSELIKRRSSHEPLQYIIGNQNFMGYTFMVTPDVLIPRFDTEILAETAIKRAVADVLRIFKNISAKKGTPEFRILDLCTGSGCVATSVGLGLGERVSLKLKEFKLPGLHISESKVTGKNISMFPASEIQAPESQISETNLCLAKAENFTIFVTGADISEAAVELAEKNWNLNYKESGINESGNVRIKAKFAVSDLFYNIEGRFHIITANPPYIVREEIETLMPEITEHEPHLALDGGDDGMDFYRRIVREAPEYLYPGGRLLMEFDDSQAEPVAEMMKKAGFREVEVHRDLAHLRRVIEGVI